MRQTTLDCDRLWTTRWRRGRRNPSLTSGQPSYGFLGGVPPRANWYRCEVRRGGRKSGATQPRSVIGRRWRGTPRDVTPRGSGAVPALLYALSIQYVQYLILYHAIVHIVLFNGAPHTLVRSKGQPQLPPRGDAQRQRHASSQMWGAPTSARGVGSHGCPRRPRPAAATAVAGRNPSTAVRVGASDALSRASRAPAVAHASCCECDTPVQSMAWSNGWCSARARRGTAGRRRPTVPAGATYHV